MRVLCEWIVPLMLAGETSIVERLVADDSDVGCRWAPGGMHHAPTFVSMKFRFFD